MKTTELEGAELAYWVARAVGKKVEPVINSKTGEVAEIIKEARGTTDYEVWNPHENWSQLGPLIEQYAVTLYGPNIGADGIPVEGWAAEVHDKHGIHPHQNGSTPLIAACRAIVAAEFGEEVDDET